MLIYTESGSKINTKEVGYMKNLRKISAIILALVMITAALIPASAAQAKSIRFLNDFIDSKTLEVELDDSAFSGGGIPITDVDVKAKFEGENKTKIAGTANVGPISDVKIFGSKGKLDGYFSIFKVNVSEIIGTDIDIDGIANKFYPILEKLDKDTVNLLELKETKDVSLKNYGTVKAEILTVSADKIAEMVKKEAAKQGKSAEIEGKDIAALVAFAKELNIPELMYYIALYEVGTGENGVASFYYKGDNLVGIRINLVDEKTLKETSLDTTEAINLKIESIKTNVSDSAFNAPAFSIDITGLVKWIFSLILGR